MHRLKAFDSFKSPAYRLFYSYMLGNTVAMNMQTLARSLLVYRLTGSAVLLGVLSMANGLPLVLLSIFAGIIADRVQKKYILMIAGAVSMVVALSVALSLTLGYLSSDRAGSWWILLASALLDGTAHALDGAARNSIPAEIVGHEQVMNAVALNVTGQSVLRLAAPALAWFFIDTFGFQAIYYTMAGLNFWAVASVALMPLTSKITSDRRTILGDIKGVLIYIQQQRNILLILAFVLGATFLGTPYQCLLPIFTEDILKVGATGLGVLSSVSGIGAIVVGLVLASLPNKKRGIMLILTGIIVGLAVAGFSFSNSWHLSLVLVAFVGVGQTGRSTLSSSLLQYYTKDELRGRVISIWGIESGLQNFGGFFASLLVATIGIRWSVGGFALVLVLFSLLALAFVPRLRNLN